MNQFVHIAYVDNDPTDQNSNPDSRLMRELNSGIWNIYDKDGNLVSSSGQFGSIQDPVAANDAGTQADATVITQGTAVIRSGIANASVIVTTDVAISQSILVANLTADTKRLYAPVGHEIGNSGVNNPATISAGFSTILTRVTDTEWVVTSVI